MVYETNCTEITQDKWRELMKYGRKCSYRMLAARIKRELPELYHALAFYFTDVSVKFMMGNTMYEYVHTVYDRRYDNGVFNTLAVVYNYKKMKYEVLVVSDEKVGDKEIQII